MRSIHIAAKKAIREKEERKESRSGHETHPFETLALSRIELQFVGEISSFPKLFT
jgi:hypothetical protein